MKRLTRVFGTGLAIATLAAPVVAQEKIKMATIAPGSSAYQVMTAMASAVNNSQNDYEVFVDAIGSETKHMIDAAQGKLDIVMSSPEVMDFMQDGTAMYAKLSSAADLRENLSLIYWFPFGAYHAATQANSGINSLADLKGKQVFLGPLGGGSFNTAKQWIEVTTGLKAGEDYTPVKSSWASAVQKFKNGEIDVYFSTGNAPYPLIEELGADSQLRLLGLTKKQADGALSGGGEISDKLKANGNSLDVIPLGAYDGKVVNDSNVYTIGTTAGIVARSDLDEEAVYKITKAFWTALPEIQKTSTFMKKVSLENAFNATNVKLHPGALKFYKEIGAKIPKEIM